MEAAGRGAGRAERGRGWGGGGKKRRRRPRGFISQVKCVVSGLDWLRAHKRGSGRGLAPASRRRRPSAHRARPRTPPAPLTVPPRPAPPYPRAGVGSTPEAAPPALCPQPPPRGPTPGAASHLERAPTVRGGRSRSDSPHPVAAGPLGRGGAGGGPAPLPPPSEPWRGNGAADPFPPRAAPALRRTGVRSRPRERSQNGAGGPQQRARRSRSEATAFTSAPVIPERISDLSAECHRAAPGGNRGFPGGVPGNSVITEPGRRTRGFPRGGDVTRDAIVR